MRKKVLVAERIADEAMERLQQNFDVDFINNIPRDQLLACIHEYDELIVRSVTKADEELTRNIKEAGLLLDIRVLDHLIITSEGYYSFADEGLI